ncbi:hypothetical protein HanHA300_Chr12g0450421 [Helianthus annuus]|nr:hypothetical protein HanHA300_Chr12g0450421 [Helianthus annuus]
MDKLEKKLSISCSSCIYHNESMYVVLQVVPPDQARKICQALKAKGLPVALVDYEEEQDGFSKAAGSGGIGWSGGCCSTPAAPPRVGVGMALPRWRGYLAWHGAGGRVTWLALVGYFN